jgi:hypothetical protein
MRKRVYIAGPLLKGDLGENIGRAVDAMHALMRAGLAPFCPHLSCYSGPVQRTYSGTPYALADYQPRGTTADDWFATDLPWVRVSHALLRLPGESVGADAEVAEAVVCGVPVFHSVPEVIEWAAGSAEEAA